MHTTTAQITTAVLLLSLAPLSAQLVYNGGSAPTPGGSNVIPFGNTSISTTWSNQKYQTIMLKTTLPRVGTLCSLGFSSSTTGVKRFDTIEVVIGYLPGTGSTLSTTFASNLTKAVTVLKAKNYAFPVTQNTWTNIGLQQPFLYIQTLGHLVVQITVTNARGTGGMRSGTSTSGGAVVRMYDYRNWVNGMPPATGTLSASSGLRMQLGFGTWAVGNYDTGCPGSNKTTPVLTVGGSSKYGGTLTVGVTGALPSANMFMNIGVTHFETAFDLTVSGAPGCLLYTDSLMLLTTAADANGNYAARFAMPKQAPACSKVYLQFFPFDKKANALGLSATNYSRIVIGN